MIGSLLYIGLLTREPSSITVRFIYAIHEIMNLKLEAF